VLADRVQEEKYADVEKKKSIASRTRRAGSAFTDKYWATTLIPSPNAKISARFQSGQLGALKTYQADYFLETVTVPPGGSADVTTRLFAGAKEVALIDIYNNALKLDRFDI
jgi:YidC/Oxa1 family membrane protein insertase